MASLGARAHAHSQVGLIEDRTRQLARPPVALEEVIAEATGSKPAQALLASEQPASDGASKKRGSDGESPEGPSRKKGKRAKKQKGGK